MFQRITIKFLKDLIQMKESAYRRFYSEYYDMLIKYAMSIIKNEEDAQDIVSDLIVGLKDDLTLVLETNKDVYSKKRFKKWLLANLRNKVYRALDKNIKRNNNECSLEEYLIPSTDDRFSYELLMDIHILFDVEEREIFMLKFYYDYTIKEISEALNIHQSKIKKKLIKIKSILKSYMGGEL